MHRDEQIQDWIGYSLFSEWYHMMLKPQRAFFYIFSIVEISFSFDTILSFWRLLFWNMVSSDSMDRVMSMVIDSRFLIKVAKNWTMPGDIARNHLSWKPDRMRWLWVCDSWIVFFERNYFFLRKICLLSVQFLNFYILWKNLYQQEKNESKTILFRKLQSNLFFESIHWYLLQFDLSFQLLSASNVSKFDWWKFILSNLCKK